MVKHWKTMYCRLRDQPIFSNQNQYLY